MIKKFNLKLIVFLIACLYSTVLSAQINSTPAVVPFGANPNYGTNGIMPDAATLPSGGTYGKSQDAADAYNEWKANYIESCGSGIYRVKFDEPARTVSEGVAYGLQLAAYAADKTLFDGLYKYWENFASPNTGGRPGKLMNWRVDGCAGVSGTGSAADADVDAAWALLIAENQWPTATSPYDYGAEANDVLNSIRALEINGQGQLINGDGWGFGNDCRNPSYQSPAYYPYFATANASNAGAWNGAIPGAYTLLNQNAHPTTGLISDWSNPQGVRNTCNPAGLGNAATDGYGYDASRNPWRMGQDVIWNNSAQGKAIADKLAAYLSGRGAGNVGGPLFQNGGNYAGYQHNATFVSTFAMGVMGSSSTNQALMNAMYKETVKTKDVIKNSTLSGYFGNTLRAVALFMMSGNYWKPGTSSIQDINVRQTTLNIPNAGLFDFQNQQNSVAGGTGKPVTFTIENLGFANLLINGTPKVVVSGVNAADFTVTTQPAAGSLALAATTTFVVTFNPTTNGTKNAILTIASNDPDELSYVINIKGTGTSNITAPKMTVYDTVAVLASGASFPMGAFTAGSTGSKILKITNTGDAPLNISAVAFSNVAFSLVSPLPASLPYSIAIGKTGYLTIGYAAPAVATTSASTITLTTTDPDAPTFLLNATASSTPCSANPPNKMMLDYDGNVNLKLAFMPKGAFSPIAVNPNKTGLNLSPTVASYVRPAAGTTTPVWDGKYDIIRYYNCGTVAAATHAASTYIPFNITTANPAIQILFYSPAVGVPVTVAPQKPDPATTTGWLPLIADYSSNVTVTTTKANQWELLTFDMSKIIALTANFKVLDIQIDPELAYAGLPANAAAPARTFYIDEIKYGINPCVNDLSGILQDFDTHTNTSLDYAVAALVAPVVNPFSNTDNSSANVGQFTKTKNAVTYDDGFRYNGCGNKIDFTTKKYISMLVYSPVANLPIQISAKKPDGADADVFPDDAASNTQNTVFANKWHRIYFDLSSIAAADLGLTTSIDIFFDALDASTITSGGKIYFDDIRLETALPCVTGIPATDILNDFESNRYLGVAFPGATPVAPAVTYFNSIKANPSATGINTSTVVGEFLRGTAGTGTSVRFTGCQNQLDLTAGHNIIELNVLSPNAGAAVTLSLKSAAGVSLLDVTDTVKLANTWTNLRFDVTSLLNATNVANIDVIVDANSIFSGATSTAAARTYYFDNLKYAAASPEINVRALVQPKPLDIASTGSISLGTAAIGDSTLAIDFVIQNNGLQTLTLTGTPILVVGGANAADFEVTTTQTFTSSISAFGATGFVVKFKPKGTVAGPRSASITITSNDANEGTYIFYLNGTATAPKIAVLNGGLTTSPVVPTGNTPAINVGSVSTGTPAPAYTFSIKNTGTGLLDIKSLVASAGFTASALTPVSPIAASSFSTFTIVGTPALPGVNTGTITITTNDPLTPIYVVNITVTGSAPTITVQDKALAQVLTNNTPAISMGSAEVGVAVVPTYTFTITNSGTAPLTVGTITSSSTVFAASAITPTGAIAAGASATFIVTSTPAAVGLNSGIITINSNDPATAAFKVNVSVTGTAASTPTVEVFSQVPALVPTNNTPAISLGTAVIGSPVAAYTFTVKNTGTGPLTGLAVTTLSPDFVVGTPSATTIAAGGSATFTVTGTPAAANTTGIINITSTNAPAYVVNVSVTGTPATPTVEVFSAVPALVPTNNTPAISLGSAVIGSPVTAYTFTVKNTGTGPLTGLAVATTSTGFVVGAPSATTIAAGGSATFTVTGTPDAATTTGIINITSTNAPAYVVNVSVTGTLAATPTVEVNDQTPALVPTNNTPAISLGSAVIGSPVAAYTFTIKNTGSAALTGLAVATTSTGFVVSAPSATTIAAGGSATFTVTGTPAAATTTGIINITSTNAPAYVVNVSVTGTVAAPTVEVFSAVPALVPTNNTPAISLGSAIIGSPVTAYTFTVKNTGTGPLTGLAVATTSTGFVVGAPSATTIAAGGSATFTVTGTPDAATTTGIINITSTNAPAYVVNVSVTGTLAATPTVEVNDQTPALVPTNNTPAISLGSAVIGSPVAAYTFTIKNTGSAALTGLAVATTSTGFVVGTPSATTIAAGGSATFTVTGTPDAATTTGIINITSTNAPAYVVNVSVTGTVASPTVEVFSEVPALVPTNNTPAISLGSAIIGSPATAYTFTVKNTGTGPLTGLAVATTSTGFVVGAPSATTIAAGGSATFTVTGTPDAASTTGIINITSTNAPAYVVNVSVTGTTGPTPTIEVRDKNAALVVTNNTPAVLLGSAVIGSPVIAYTFTINNTGTGELTGLAVATTSAGYTVGAPALTTIPAGGSTTFTVTGTPSAASTAGVINITSTNAPAYVVNVTVSGTTNPEGTVTIPGIISGVTEVNLGTVVAGTSTPPKTITINNTGSAPLVITSIDSDNAAFVVGGATFPLTIPAGGSATFTITGTPPSASVVTGTIKIVSNDPNSPFVIPVKTTGKNAPTGGELQVIDNAPGDIIVMNNNDPILIGKNAAGLPVAPYKFTLKNVGVAPITITSISGVGGFTASPMNPVGTPKGTIAPGESAVITVSGTPLNSSADRVGAITIFTSDPSQTFTLNVKVSVGTPTGVAVALSASAIDVYPNPTIGTSYVAFNNNFDDVNVIVYSVDGNVVMTQKLASVSMSQTAKLDKIDELAAGIYMVEITTTQGKVVKRLIKQ